MLVGSLVLTLIVGHTSSSRPIVVQRFPLRYDRNASYQTVNSYTAKLISAALSARFQGCPDVPKNH